MASSEEGEPVCGGGATVWYSYTPPADQVVFAVSDYDGGLGVYEGSALSALTPIACVGPRGGDSHATVSLKYGHSYYFQATYDPADSPSDDAIEIKIQKAGSISGRVVKPGGAPLAGVCVHVVNQSFYWSDPTIDSASAVTDAGGAYQVTGLSAGMFGVRFGCFTGEYETKFWDEGTGRVVVRVGEDSDGVSATLAPIRTGIHGIVKDVLGRPLSDAEVWADAVDGSWYNYSTTGADGSYTLSLRPSTYRVTFVRDGYRTTYFRNADVWDSATKVPVEDGIILDGIDATLATLVPPPNDNLADAEAVTSFPFVERVDFQLATMEAREPTGCGDFDGNSVWYRLEPQTTETVVFSAPYSNLAVYNSTDTSILHRVSCTNTARGIHALSFVAQPGTVYFVQVIHWEAAATVKADVTVPFSTATFAAPVPCAEACPYSATSGAGLEGSCAEKPPAPSGSWDDLRIDVPQTVEGGVPTYLVFDLDPAIDRDSFICRVEPGMYGDRFMAEGANALGDPGPCSKVVVTCRETVAVAVTPGESLILRVYNYSEIAPTPGVISFIIDRNTA